MSGPCEGFDHTGPVKVAGSANAHGWTCWRQEEATVIYHWHVDHCVSYDVQIPKTVVPAPVDGIAPDLTLTWEAP